MSKKILVVDDEPDIVALLEKKLKAESYEVSVAYDGEEALQKVEDSSPDLIILDIMIPKIDGYEVCRRLAKDDRYKHIPVLMLTACREFDQIKEGMQVGAVSYVTKPIKLDQLMTLVRGFVK